MSTTATASSFSCACRGRTLANGITIEVKGLEQIKKSLAALPAEIQKKVMDQSVRAGVVDWQKHAAARAPAYDRVHVAGRKGKQVIIAPGNLRRSIRVRKLKSRNAKESRYGIQISKRAFYWIWVEFGSRNNQRIPFLRSTFDARATLAINNIAGDCAKFIEKYFKSRTGALVRSYLKTR